MPKIFEYLGIIIRFFSNEHSPIHVHAFYNDAEIKIELHIKNGIITTKYFPVKGKFPDAKLKDLEFFMHYHKGQCVWWWEKYFVENRKVKFKKFTKKFKP